MQVVKEITNESEADEKSDNELHLPEVNNYATSMTQPDQLDNSPDNPEAIEKHSSKSKEVVWDSKRNQGKCKSKRWKWTPEMVDNLEKCLSNIKSWYELKGLDFESDYVALYTKATEAMAALHDEDDKMNECNEGMHDDGEGVTQNRDARAEDILESASDNSPSVLNSAEQQRVSNQNRKWKNAVGTLQTFVDNKHKQLEKNLCAAQRDQMFLKWAKDELKMKEAMVVSLGESATQTKKAMDKIAESITLFSKALGNGLTMIAMAMVPPQRQQVPSTPQASQMQMFSSHPPGS